MSVGVLLIKLLKFLEEELMSTRTLRGIQERLFFVMVLAATVLLAETLAFANDGKVTFHNNATEPGKIHATIYYRKNNVIYHCKVTGTVNHPVGTDPNVKAAQLAADITAQCDYVEASADKGKVIMTVHGGRTLTEISIDDKTKQRKTIDPCNLDDGKIIATIRLEGTSTGGTALVSLDNCGSSASTPTAGKTGAQVVADLAAGLTNCDAASGSTISAVDLGGGVGELRLHKLSKANSVVTFDSGGANGLDEIFSVRGVTPVVPATNKWGLIVMAVVLLSAGGFVILRRRTATV